MSTDKNFSTADNNGPQPSTEEPRALGNNPKNAHLDPKYTQLYGLEGIEGKMSLEPQAGSEPQGTKKKEESHERVPKQFDIDPNTRKSLLIAQAIRNVLIIIPVFVLLFIFIQAAIYIMVSERDEFSDLIFAIVAIATVVALPYMIHIFLQIIAFMRFRKSVKFRWIRGVNIYGLIVAPISEVTYVPFMLERILDPSSSAESSFTIVGVIVALYEVILGILMIVVTTNSIKKTDKSSEQKQHEVSERVPDESL